MSFSRAPVWVALMVGFLRPACLTCQTDLFEWSLAGSVAGAGRPSAVALSPDGERGAVASAGVVSWFGTGSRPLSLNWVAGPGPAVRFLRFSADGSRLFCARSNGRIEVYSLPGGESRAFSTVPRLTAAAVSRDGALLSTATEGRDALLWDSAAGRPLGSFQHASKRPFLWMEFADKDGLLIGVGASGTICAWDTKTRNLIYQHQDADQTIQAAAIRENGALLAVATESADFEKGALGGLRPVRPTDIHRDNRIKILDVRKGAVVKTLDGIGGTVPALALSADGRFVSFIRSQTKSSALTVYDVQRGVEVATVPLVAPGSLVAFNYRGQWLVTASADGEVAMRAIRGVRFPDTEVRLGARKVAITSANPDPLVSPPRPTVVAVANFETNNLDGGIGRSVADMVRTRIGEGRNVIIVERDRMEQILKEQNFGVSDRVDPQSAVRLGRLLGVRKVVFGSVGRLGEQYLVHIRAVDVETGEIDGAREAICEPCEPSDLQETIVVMKPVLVR